jgi:hypothetical protein
VRLAQSPRELSSPVPHMRCAEFGQLWLNPIMSNVPRSPLFWITLGYWWSCYSHAIRLLLLSWILMMFGPSTKACRGMIFGTWGLTNSIRSFSSSPLAMKYGSLFFVCLLREPSVAPRNHARGSKTLLLSPYHCFDTPPRISNSRISI